MIYINIYIYIRYSRGEIIKWNRNYDGQWNKKEVTERKIWRFSSDIKKGQAIWKRSRDEVKPTDD